MFGGWGCQDEVIVLYYVILFHFLLKYLKEQNQGRVVRICVRSCAVMPLASDAPYPAKVLTVVSQVAAVLPMIVYSPALSLSHSAGLFATARDAAA